MGRARRFLSSVFLLLGLASPVLAQSRIQNIPANTSMAQTGTEALNTVKVNFSISSTPAAPGAASLSGTAGNCITSNTYRFFVVFGNQSGWTSVGAQSPDYTPGTTNRMATVPIPAGVPSTATSWRVLFRRSGDSFATLRTCNNVSGPWISTGTSTFDCACTASANTWTNTNTTGTRTIQDIRDGEIRIAGMSTASSGASQGLPLLTEGVQRFRMSAAPSWSSDSGTNYGPLLGGGPTTIVVSKTGGAAYTTVQAAVNAITDATSTKRYSVLIMPGDYDEVVTAKSYVSFVGMEKGSTRIRGGTLGEGAFKIPDGVSEVVISNLTLGDTGVVVRTSTTKQVVTVTNCIIGIVDSSWNASIGGSQDCFYIEGGANGADVYSFGNLCRSIFDAVSIGQNARFFGFGNHYELDNQSNNNEIRVWRTSGVGAQLYETGSKVLITNAGTNSGKVIWGAGVVGGFTSTGATQGYALVVRNTDISIVSTNSARTADTSCFYLDDPHTDSIASFTDFSGSTCEISLHASATSVVNGLNVIATADHSNWTSVWNGGRIKVTAAGGTVADIKQSETVGGYTLSIANIIHNGTYSGAGTITAADTRIGAFSTRLIGRVGDLVAATCTPGEIALDTGGANKEICICDTGPAWACATVDTATGPTN